MTSFRTLIIEDNAIARMDLLDRLSVHPEIVVIGQAESIGSARPLLALNNYDLVFLDIQLRGEEAFDLMPDVSPAAHVVFVTAYDDYAVRAFAVNAFDYLLKPVEPSRLAQTLQRLQTKPAPSDSLATDPPFATPLRSDDRVHVRQATGSQFVQVDSIATIVSAQNYTQVALIDGTKLMVRRPMKQWESHLNANEFIRVARDTLINLQHVTKYERLGQRGGQIWLRGITLPIQSSFRLWPQVKARLERTNPTGAND